MDASIRVGSGTMNQTGLSMPWTAKFNERLRAVEVISQGIITSEDLRQQTRETLALSTRHRTDQFLIDAHQLQSAFTVFDLIALVEAFRELGAPQPGRMAVVLPVSSESARTVRFFETVARNRTYDVRVFRNRARAEAWLAQGSEAGAACPGDPAGYTAPMQTPPESAPTSDHA